MTQDKWQNIVGLIKDKFAVEDEGREELEDIPRASVEFIIFAGPLGRMKLEARLKLFGGASRMTIGWSSRRKRRERFLCSADICVLQSVQKTSQNWKR